MALKNRLHRTNADCFELRQTKERLEVRLRCGGELMYLQGELVASGRGLAELTESCRRAVLTEKKLKTQLKSAQDEV